jgi:PKD repeat protein
MENSTKIISTLLLIGITIIASIAAYTLAVSNTQNIDSNNEANTNTDIGDIDHVCAADSSNLEPFASFYVTPTILTINHPIKFLDASKAGSGAITNWSWNFGEGQIGNIANPTHIYSSTGEKTVTLTVTNTNGKTSTSTRTFTVTESHVYETSFVEFETSPYTIYVSQPVTFSEVSMSGFSPSLQWFWDFGDGTTSTDQRPTHTYSSSGEKQVTLSVVDAQFRTNSVTHTIVVNEMVAPVAEFTFTPTQPLVGNTVFFHCTTTVGSGTINRFL